MLGDSLISPLAGETGRWPASCAGSAAGPAPWRADAPIRHAASRRGDYLSADNGSHDRRL